MIINISSSSSSISSGRSSKKEVFYKLSLVWHKAKIK